jgi:DNA-binding FrmR family transcriptional regulator
VQVRNPQDGSQNLAPILASLRRIEGQVRALQHQLEQDADFLSVLTQTAAASKALQSVARRLVEARVARAVAEVGEGEERARQAIDDLNLAVDRLLKV